MGSMLRRRRRVSLFFLVVLVTLSSGGGGGGCLAQKTTTGSKTTTTTGSVVNQEQQQQPSSLNSNGLNGGGSSDLDACKGEKWCATLDGAEALALDAIRSLHRQLDDDENGNIDLSETKDFLTEELKYEKNVENRQKAFHQNDDTQVSVQELWETWIKSEVHNWTVEQTVEWLIIFVGLPQHQDKFTARHVNGTVLPILAVNHNNFLQTQLGVKDTITRQRIAVKAMDVVLFGPPRDTTNRIKDVILTTLLAVAVIACYLVYKRYQWAQEDLTKMSKHMAELSKAEETLLDLQKELEKAKTDQEKKESVVQGRSNILGDDLDPDELAKLREENMVLRSELHRAEVELQDKCWVPPPALQHWMQYTYELELKTYNKKKNGAEKQLKLAKDACDKLKKKRSSLMGAFVTTHGRSIDDVDKAILEARTSLTEITHELQERMHRWKQIELLIGCSLMNNPGIHYLENMLKVYGKPQYAAGPGSVISNSQDDIDDDAASSIYCPSAVHKLVGSSTYLMFPGHQSYSYYPPFASAHIFSCHHSPTDYPNASTVANGNICSFAPSGNIPRIPSESSFSTSTSTVNVTGSPVSCCTPLNPTDLTSISEDSVSGPTSHMQLTMPRSKSSSSMLNLRERGMSRESSSKDSSNGEDDIVGLDPSDMTNARRVTFRADHRSRMKSYSNGRSNGGGNGSSLFDSMDNEEARRVVSKALSQTQSLESITSPSKPEAEESVPQTEEEVMSSDLLSPVGEIAPPPPLPLQPTPIPPPTTVETLQLKNDANVKAACDVNGHRGHIHVNNGVGVPIEATYMQYSSSTKGKGGKLWSAISKLVHHSNNKGHSDNKGGSTTEERDKLENGVGNVGGKTSTLSNASMVNRKSSRRLSGMFSSFRRHSKGGGSGGKVALEA